MDFLRVSGAEPLRGRVKISGAKNAALPVLAAALLVPGKTILKNIPDLTDTRTMLKLLKILGASWERKGGDIIIDASDIRGYSAPYELVKTMRASIYAMGPLLARKGRAEVSFPGGCSLGTRPIDIHLNGFKKLGAKIAIDEGNIEASGNDLKGAEMFLDFPSVGATANILMAAVLVPGITLIRNFAKEPEIYDLIGFLKKCGADIKEDPSAITVQGVKELKSAEYTIIQDRIELGTIGMAAIATKGEVELEWNCTDLIVAVREKLLELGADVRLEKGRYIFRYRPLSGHSKIKTLPYPGFPTDLQPVFGALLASSSAEGSIEETIFENRFMWVPELLRMGADIEHEGETVHIKGRPLSGAPVMCSDIRAGAAVLTAALSAQGNSNVSRIYHLDRGYEKFTEKFTALGARMERGKE